jgi:hypothetical protein
MAIRHGHSSFLRGASQRRMPRCSRIAVLDGVVISSGPGTHTLAVAERFAAQLEG